jgi:hypothetical protein
VPKVKVKMALPPGGTEQEGKRRLAKQNVQFQRCAASFVTAAYRYVRLIPQDLHALNLELFALPAPRRLFTKPSLLTG